jgi:hypothetical protein
MRPRARRRRIYEAHVERLRADLDDRLTLRKLTRSAASDSARLGARTKRRRQFVNDPVRNELVPF